MARPRGAARAGDALIADENDREGWSNLWSEARKRFEKLFGRKWSGADANEILGVDAATITAWLGRPQRRALAQARKALNELRSRALKARKAAAAAPNEGDGHLLRELVAKLPPELLADEAPWESGRKVSAHRRVLSNAPRVLGRSLKPRELAVVGILSGVRVRIRKGETVAEVLRRESLAYSSMRRR